MVWMDWMVKSIKISNQAKPVALVLDPLVVAHVPHPQKCQLARTPM
jgi:hypothetical protein